MSRSIGLTLVLMVACILPGSGQAEPAFIQNAESNAPLIVRNNNGLDDWLLELERVVRSTSSLLYFDAREWYRGESDVSPNMVMEYALISGLGKCINFVRANLPDVRKGAQLTDADIQRFIVHARGEEYGTVAHLFMTPRDYFDSDMAKDPVYIFNITCFFDGSRELAGARLWFGNEAVYGKGQ